MQMLDEEDFLAECFVIFREVRQVACTFEPTLLDVIHLD